MQLSQQYHIYVIAYKSQVGDFYSKNIVVNGMS